MKIKGIKKMLVASMLACAMLLHAQAEENPSGYRNAWGYGIKLGASVSSFRSIISQKDIKDLIIREIPSTRSIIEDFTLEKPFFAAWGFMPALYVEYAFTNYLGAALEVGYMQQGGALKLLSGKKEQLCAGTITTHGFVLSSPFYIYLFGREEGKGIFKIGPGLTAYRRLSKLSVQGKYKFENLTGPFDIEIDSSYLSRWNVAVHFNIGYEWPFGVSLEARYGFGFSNMVSKEGQKWLSDNNIKEAFKGQYLALSLGCNIASVFI